jgi:hypothetical protein
VSQLRQYENWSIDRLSLSLDLLSLDVARHFATSTGELATLAQRSRVRICFTGVERILLSDLSAGEIIHDVEHKDATGKTTYRLTLSGRSFIEIAAAGFAELPY